MPGRLNLRIVLAQLFLSLNWSSKFKRADLPKFVPNEGFKLEQLPLRQRWCSIAIIMPNFSTQAKGKVGIVYLCEYWTPAEWSTESRECISSHFLSKMILKGYAEYHAMCFSLQPLVVDDDEIFFFSFGDGSHHPWLVMTQTCDSC